MNKKMNEHEKTNKHDNVNKHDKLNNQNQNQKCFIWPKENIYLFIQFIIVTVGQGDPP